jgi:hypothetical protein
MERRDVPPSEWQAFCDQLSASHRRWRASIRVVDAGRLREGLATDDPSALAIADEATLHSVAVDQSARPAQLTLIADAGSERINHVVPSALRLEVEQEAGATAALHVYGVDSRATELRFQRPAPTEAVDGLP